MYNEDLTELYEVNWRPQSTQVHPTENPLHPVPVPHPSAAAYLSTRKVPSKPVGAYRPPGARGQSTPLAFRREDEGGAAFVRSESGTGGISQSKLYRRGVPGAEPSAGAGGVPGAAGNTEEKLSKSAAKNRKKREAKKVRENEETPPEPAANGTKKPSNGAAASATPAAPAAVSVPAPPPTSERNGPPAGSPQDKKIRGLLKKMRAIDELRMKLAGGEKLEDTQMKKIEAEETIRKELESSGWTGQE